MAKVQQPDPKLMLRSSALPSWTPTTASPELIRHPVINAIWHIIQELLVGAGLRITSRTVDRSVPEEELQLLYNLQQVEGLMECLRHLTSAHILGAAICEIVWGADYLPRMFRTIPIEQVQFGIDEYGMVTSVRVNTQAGIQELPLSHTLYLIPSWGILYREPRLHAFRRYLDAYDRVLRALDLYIQRHALPTTVATIPNTYTEQETQQIYDALVSMKDAFVAVIPAGQDAKLDFLEPRGTGMDLALQFLQLLERLIARALLGSILAVYEAQYGTRAQAQVHWDVVKRIIASMQQPIERVLQTQLWQPIVQLQLGRDPISAIELNEPDQINSDALVRNLADLTTLGIVDPVRDRDWLRALLGIDG